VPKKVILDGGTGTDEFFAAKVATIKKEKQSTCNVDVETKQNVNRHPK